MHELTPGLAFCFAFDSVDLFVRKSNESAVQLYESLGYVIYRRVIEYYGGGPNEPDEDAYGKARPTLSVCLVCRADRLTFFFGRFRYAQAALEG